MKPNQPDQYVVLCAFGKTTKRACRLAEEALAQMAERDPLDCRPAWFSGNGYLAIRSDRWDSARDIVVLAFAPALPS